MKPDEKSNSSKDRTVKCQACKGLLVVKNSIDYIPVCYGINIQKEIKMSDLKQDAKKLHAYQFEKSNDKKTTAFYFGDSMWLGVAKKSPQGIQKNILVHPTFSVVMRLNQEQVASPNSSSTTSSSSQKVLPDSPKGQQQSIDQWVSNTTEMSTKILLSLQKNMASVQSSLTPEKYAALYHKFVGTATHLGTNLTTDFVPRFSDASTKVAGASIKVAQSTFDTVYSIFFK